MTWDICLLSSPNFSNSQNQLRSQVNIPYKNRVKWAFRFMEESLRWTKANRGGMKSLKSPQRTNMILSKAYFLVHRIQNTVKELCLICYNFNSLLAWSFIFNTPQIKFPTIYLICAGIYLSMEKQNNLFLSVPKVDSCCI